LTKVEKWERFVDIVENGGIIFFEFKTKKV
jgi:hypothetical protein